MAMKVVVVENQYVYVSLCWGKGRLVRPEDVCEHGVRRYFGQEVRVHGGKWKLGMSGWQEMGQERLLGVFSFLWPV
jgi:hypothetical protein